jgi:hypothetical protein
MGRLEISEDDGFYMYKGIRTMAEPRPNAYIPDSLGLIELPIPKPYGSQAPYRPQEVPSLLRHYKKPANKPVQL